MSFMCSNFDLNLFTDKADQDGSNELGFVTVFELSLAKKFGKSLHAGAQKKIRKF